MDDGDGEERLFSETLRRSQPNQWLPRDVDLSRFAGKTVRLTFATARVEDKRPRAERQMLPLWGKPSPRGPLGGVGKAGHHFDIDRLPEGRPHRRLRLRARDNAAPRRLRPEGHPLRELHHGLVLHVAHTRRHAYRASTIAPRRHTPPTDRNVGPLHTRVFSAFRLSHRRYRVGAVSVSKLRVSPRLSHLSRNGRPGCIDNRSGARAPRRRPGTAAVFLPPSVRPSLAVLAAGSVSHALR